MNNPSSTNTAILLAKFQLRPDAENPFAEWQARALTHAAGFEGFLNSEITPSGQGLAWNVLLRFADSARLEAWRKSETWHRLLEDAAPLLAEKSSIEVEVKEAEGGSGVVEVIITQVKPGKEAAYREWETRIQQAQSKFPGYRGLLCPASCLGRAGMDNVDALRHRETTRHMAQVSGASCISQRGGIARGLRAFAENGNVVSRMVPDGSKNR